VIYPTALPLRRSSKVSPRSTASSTLAVLRFSSRMVSIFMSGRIRLTSKLRKPVFWLRSDETVVGARWVARLSQGTNPGASREGSRLKRSISTRWNSMHLSMSLRSKRALPRCAISSLTPLSSRALRAALRVVSTAVMRSLTVFGGVPGAMPQKWPASRKYFGRVGSFSQSLKTGCSMICFTASSSLRSALSRAGRC
jgi:hypothetical protein